MPGADFPIIESKKFIAEKPYSIIYRLTAQTPGALRDQRMA
jgi:hypothetical protein